MQARSAHLKRSFSPVTAAEHSLTRRSMMHDTNLPAPPPNMEMDNAELDDTAQTMRSQATDSAAVPLETPRAVDPSQPTLQVTAVSITAAPEDCAAWHRVRHAGITGARAAAAAPTHVCVAYGLRRAGCSPLTRAGAAAPRAAARLQLEGFPEAVVRRRRAARVAACRALSCASGWRVAPLTPPTPTRAAPRRSARNRATAWGASGAGTASALPRR